MCIDLCVIKHKKVKKKYAILVIFAIIEAKVEIKLKEFFKISCNFGKKIYIVAK